MLRGIDKQQHALQSVIQRTEPRVIQAGHQLGVIIRHPLPRLVAMLMFAYVLLMVPLLYVIDSRLSASRLVRKATQNVIIIALTLLFFSAMTLLY